jgi:hypothetical protein
VPGRETSTGEFKARLSQEQRSEIDAHLKEGRSVAAYADERGRRPALVITFGTRDSDLPYQHPPATYGRGELLTFVYAQPKQRGMQSPATSWEQVPQIARPRVAPTQTQYPEVLISGRTGPHPRGQGGGWIEAQGLVPGREQAQPQAPAEPLSPEQQWWSKQLGR